MSRLSDFVGGGGGLKPFQDLGTVTGTVNLDLSQYGSFRVVQGAGDVTLNVINADPDGAGVFELFFYRNYDWAVSFSGFEFIEDGYQDSLVGDMTAINYDSVLFNVEAQEPSATAKVFNTDGTKMFLTGFSSSVHQYTLTTGFDLSTISYDSVVFDASAQMPSPIDIAFNTDGTKMFLLCRGNEAVYQYTLTTGFDLSTASYDSVSFSVGLQDGYPYGIAFNNDGTKMFILGNLSEAVYQYTLTTGFDLSTASYDSVSFGVGRQDVNPGSIAFNNDGTRMFILGYNTERVYQYTLTTGFDVSTASYDNGSFDVSAQSTLPYDITFSTDRTKMFMLSYNTDSIYQYTTDYDSNPTYTLTHIGNIVTLETQSVPYSIKELI